MIGGAPAPTEEEKEGADEVVRVVILARNSKRGSTSIAGLRPPSEEGKRQQDDALQEIKSIGRTSKISYIVVDPESTNGNGDTASLLASLGLSGAEGGVGGGGLWQVACKKVGAGLVALQAFNMFETLEDGREDAPFSLPRKCPKARAQTSDEDDGASDDDDGHDPDDHADGGPHFRSIDSMKKLKFNAPRRVPAASVRRRHKPAEHADGAAGVLDDTLAFEPLDCMQSIPIELSVSDEHAVDSKHGSGCHKHVHFGRASRVEYIFIDPDDDDSQGVLEALADLGGEGLVLWKDAYKKVMTGTKALQAFSFLNSLPKVSVEDAASSKDAIGEADSPSLAEDVRATAEEATADDSVNASAASVIATASAVQNMKTFWQQRCDSNSQLSPAQLRLQARRERRGSR